MLERTRRVTKIMFDDVLKNGVSSHSPSFSFKILRKTAQIESRFSVVVSKKVAKSAVKRNRLRRIVQAIVRVLYSRTVGGNNCLVFIKKDISQIKNENLKSELEGSLIRAGVIK